MRWVIWLALRDFLHGHDRSFYIPTAMRRDWTDLWPYRPYVYNFYNRR